MMLICRILITWVILSSYTTKLFSLPYSSGHEVCRVKRESCAVESGCPTGEKCDFGKCCPTNIKLLHERCGSWRDCCSGICFKGKCCQLPFCECRNDEDCCHNNCVKGKCFIQILN